MVKQITFHRIQLTYSYRKILELYNWNFSLIVQKLLIASNKHKTKWIVQTGSVKKAFVEEYGIVDIQISAFWDDRNFLGINWCRTTNNLIYLSNGAVHKNHLRLLKAWSLANKPSDAKLLLSFQIKNPEN